MERTHNDELLTIKEAAARLKVSTMTLSRWIKAGRLTKYRLGARAVRLRRSEVEALHSPDEMEFEPAFDDDLDIPPLTPEEVDRQLAAMERANAVRERILNAHGGKPFPSSAELINEERDARSFDA
ncbi:MAG TPA: helix-turn-helix domain-containing protein [Thermomicrobiaceae bacterium]|nr:helix-turn-helix domain-containing protein [Thermomicrobiaceae bacterium]